MAEVISMRPQAPRPEEQAASLRPEHEGSTLRLITRRMLSAAIELHMRFYGPAETKEFLNVEFDTIKERM